ncbi:DUF3696 domain-containing protein [Vibrio lentus]|uniref:DUF3696 domain-containing protein n=1 Tax=Vibrio lentus TaxID=136468 RepID=A0A4U2FCL3_9VIBR|nr:DUF3696 domain-containing protein [Vibrio lentus]TKG13282.1 DUF3696 domain-containing protein [Vibrio lentus]
MPVIESISLINFKCYKNEQIKFSPLTVFCGNNSVGKSTAIQALGILLQSNFMENVHLNGELVHIGDLSDIHHFPRKNESILTIEVESRARKYKWGYENTEQREEIVNEKYLPFIGEKFDSMVMNQFLRGTFNYQYIEAERYGPRDNQPLADSSPHPLWLGTKGEHTVEVLNDLSTKSRLDLALSEADSGDPRKHKSIKNHNIFLNIEAWMGEISPGYRLNPSTEPKANVAYNSILPEDGNDTKPVNIGFGYSYVLSIVSALLLSQLDDLIVVENPEAHIHPRGQSYLGRLIALTAQAGVQVIVETHSDHLINGMRLMPRLGKVDCKNIKIYQVVTDTEEKCSKALPITVTEQGELSDWPDQFFDQQIIDMDILMSGQDQ